MGSQSLGASAIVRAAATVFGCLLLVGSLTGARLMTSSSSPGAALRPIFCGGGTCASKLQRLLYWLRGAVSANSFVVLRTANPQDAEHYYLLLLPLQEQLHHSFMIVVEIVDDLKNMIVFEVRTREFHLKYTRGMASSPSPSSPLSAEVKEMPAALAASMVSSFNTQECIVLCRIPLPDRRVYCDLPAVIPRLIAAHVNGKRLFPSYAEEMCFCLPYIEECSRHQYEVVPPSPSPQQQQHQHQQQCYLTKKPTSTATLSSHSLSVQREYGNAYYEHDRRMPMESAVSMNHAPPFGRGSVDDGGGLPLLGDVLDVNATMFSTALLVEVGDEAASAVDDAGPMNAQGEEKFICDAIHEAFFHVVLRTPLSRTDLSSAHTLHMYPFNVWRASRRSRRAAAELYVLDVAASKGDAVISFACVVDEVVAQAVLVHHRGLLVEFVDALFSRFALQYIPVIPALRRLVERGSDKMFSADGHANGSRTHNGGDMYKRTEKGDNYAEENYEDDGNLFDRDDVLRELYYIREYVLENRLTFYNAMLTTQGSNQLEEVFGVPATVFPFLPCARESVAFVTHAYDCIVREYGALNFTNFTKYAHDVFVRDRPEIVRHAPRIFRALNKTRSGVISFEELCCWMARKLSAGTRLRPDAHLIAIAMSLRLPLALLMDTRQQWSRMECALASLSDTDVDGY